MPRAEIFASKFSIFQCFVQNYVSCNTPHGKASR